MGEISNCMEDWMQHGPDVANGVLAIDPGTEESGFVICRGGLVESSGVLPNAEIKRLIRSAHVGVLAIEMFESFGMPVGRDVFETCVWIGRFIEAWRYPEDVRLVPRKRVKLHLCQSARAKDPNIRQALIDRLGKPGTKKQPGPTYGVVGHAWSALAVAVTAIDEAAAA